MNFERLWPEWIFPLITNQGKGTKEPSEQAFIKIKKYDTLESNSLSLTKSSLWEPHMIWGVCLGRMDLDEENESPPSFKEFILLPEYGYRVRYYLGKVLDTHDCLTHGSVSTHCVLHLNPVKGTFNIAS